MKVIGSVMVRSRYSQCIDRVFLKRRCCSGTDDRWVHLTSGAPFPPFASTSEVAEGATVCVMVLCQMSVSAERTTLG